MPGPKPAERPNFHRLRSLTIVGGFLDGAKIEFVPGLNCIIGARGTGKTTVLEFIRYALDRLPSMDDDRQARDRIESLVERNLKGGRIELQVETKDGLGYVISRAAGEDPVVTTAAGKPTDITLRAGGFFTANIFSQNEVESVADRALSQLALLDNFQAEAIADLEARLRQLEARLSANSHTIFPLEGQIATLAEELGMLPGVEEKLRGFAAEAGGSSEAINKAHAAKALRDREKRAVESSVETLRDYASHIGEYAGWIGQQADVLIDEEILAGPNAVAMKQLRQSLRACSADVDKAVAQAVKRVRQEEAELAETGKKLAATHTQQEQAFQALLDKHQVAQERAAERAQLERRKNELLAKKRQRDDLTTRLARLRDERGALLRELSELRDKRFSIRKAVAEKITSALDASVKVTVEQCGNPERYQSLLEEELRDLRMKRNVVAEKIVKAISPAELAELVRRQDDSALVSRAEINEEQAGKVLAALGTPEVLHKLEIVELVDRPDIEFKDGTTYKNSLTLSTGQKCTTILPILLLDSANPLLVDQPEDNLDNSFVFEKVVSNVRKVQTSRQLIFVTHNPNIPVLGEAGRVFVLRSNGKSASLKNVGSVDECRDDIVKLLEGGKEAFLERKKKYGI